MARLKNITWNCGTLNADGSINVSSVEHAQLAVMMDIRDELQQLNRTLSCPNFLGLPRDIARLRSEVSGIRRDLKKKSA